MKSPTLKDVRIVAAAFALTVLLLVANVFVADQAVGQNGRTLAPADTDTTVDTTDTLGYLSDVRPDLVRADTDTTERDTIDTMGVDITGLQ